MFLKNEKLHKEIYERLSSMYGIKFKSQLKDSPIEFNSLFKFNNLITGEESFLIIFASNESIKFKNKSEFIKEFTNYVYCKILELERRFKDLNNREYYGMKYDENDVFMEYEEIGHGQTKLNQLLDKFKKLKE
ncbi:hypothetical protein [Elizabethkingia meningoseptica]|uniref:hypothetical protein n=1 Tax=Elizabethkingia meningoseptica TaxID=238 RepID=UPI0008413B15|nr:hypothetical protein [Elizabethkingia meningoseptica]AQX10865.1 hypothetical protein BBD35_00080 [Elizabethkingia meningoseptica]ODM52292.1 hypothetical protein BES09_16075 [Elizabethkingia meningoseptica]OHT26907.1 hypothetical protein BFF93_15300 [Elizabethkingia meningoseptica]OPB71128.1 hypothetical protein BAY31_13360 [Elizabethkingia meningoseptica]